MLISLLCELANKKNRFLHSNYRLLQCQPKTLLNERDLYFLNLINRLKCLENIGVTKDFIKYDFKLNNVT